MSSAVYLVASVIRSAASCAFASDMLGAIAVAGLLLLFAYLLVAYLYGVAGLVHAFSYPVSRSVLWLHDVRRSARHVKHDTPLLIARSVARAAAGARQRSHNLNNLHCAASVNPQELHCHPFAVAPAKPAIQRVRLASKLDAFKPDLRWTACSTMHGQLSVIKSFACLCDTYCMLSSNWFCSQMRGGRAAGPRLLHFT